MARCHAGRMQAEKYSPDLRPYSHNCRHPRDRLLQADLFHLRLSELLAPTVRQTKFHHRQTQHQKLPITTVQDGNSFTVCRTVLLFTLYPIFPSTLYLYMDWGNGLHRRTRPIFLSQLQPEEKTTKASKSKIPNLPQTTFTTAQQNLLPHSPIAPQNDFCFHSQPTSQGISTKK